MTAVQTVSPIWFGVLLLISITLLLQQILKRSSGTRKLELNFKEPKIPIKQFAKGVAKKETQNYSESRFGDVMLDVNKPSNTIATDINR